MKGMRRGILHIIERVYSYLRILFCIYVDLTEFMGISSSCCM